MKFIDLRLDESILAAVAEEGYETATPIQALTIPHALEGRDVLGCAQTGTGKTAAFALPMLHRLAAAKAPRKPRQPQALVLAPTRELAAQIAESFAAYGRHTGLRGTIVYGGVGQGPQVSALRRGVNILVATPGRLLDLIQQGHCDLSTVNTFVLDEADRMLDMGFMPDIKRIIARLPEKRQTLLFSATMPQPIRELVGSLLHRPAEVTVTPDSPAVERIVQSVHHVAKAEKTALLARLLETRSISRAIVFTRTKHGADRVVRQLKHADIKAEAIHGNKSQNARRHALDRFRSGRIHVLIATDIAARGIDVDGISHVINYDIAREPESHVHRIGRTARAGAEGEAVSFCDREELPFLRAIERLIRMEIEVIGERPAYLNAPQRHNGSPKQGPPKGRRHAKPGRPQRGAARNGGGPKPASGRRRRRGRKARQG